MRSFAVLLLSLACAPEPTEMHIGFQMHEQVSCGTVEPPMQASLQASEVEGFCPLMVSANRQVTGTCYDVPAGAVRAFRLIYYATYDRDYELAVATETLDLSNASEKSIVLEFDEESLDTNRDDDGDGFLNLVEYCCGSHPGINAETCN